MKTVGGLNRTIGSKSENEVLQVAQKSCNSAVDCFMDQLTMPQTLGEYAYFLSLVIAYVLVYFAIENYNKHKQKERENDNEAK